MTNKKAFRPDALLWGLAEHQYRRHSATVDPGMKQADLENKDYWVHIARELRPGDEIRCVALDNSFVASLYVMMVQGTEVKVRCTYFTPLDKVDEKADEPYEGYKVKNGGATGWYIQKQETGERVLTGLDNQAAAYKALDEYMQALAQ